MPEMMHMWFHAHSKVSMCHRACSAAAQLAFMTTDVSAAAHTLLMTIRIKVSLNLIVTALAAGDPAYDPCRVAGHDRPRRHVLSDHRASAYCGAVAHGHAPCVAQQRLRHTPAAAHRRYRRRQLWYKTVANLEPLGTPPAMQGHNSGISSNNLNPEHVHTQDDGAAAHPHIAADGHGLGVLRAPQPVPERWVYGVPWWVHLRLHVFILGADLHTVLRALTLACMHGPVAICLANSLAYLTKILRAPCLKHSHVYQ